MICLFLSVCNPGSFSAFHNFSKTTLFCLTCHVSSMSRECNISRETVMCMCQLNRLNANDANLRKYGQTANDANLHQLALSVFKVCNRLYANDVNNANLRKLQMMQICVNSHLVFLTLSLSLLFDLFVILLFFFSELLEY